MCRTLRAATVRSSAGILGRETTKRSAEKEVQNSACGRPQRLADEGGSSDFSSSLRGVDLNRLATGGLQMYFTPRVICLVGTVDIDSS